MFKKFMKKTIATILVIMMIISSMMTGFAAVAEDAMVGGGIVNMLSGGGALILVNVLERVVVCALSETMTAEKSPQMTKALNWAGRIIGGYEGAALGQITVMCQEILEKLDVITDTINDSTRSLDSSINKVQITIDKQEYDSIYKQLDELNSSYSIILDEYRVFVKALEKYSQEPTESNLQDLKFSYDKIDRMFDNDQTAVQINFPSDLNTIMHNITPYEYTYDYSKTTSDDNDTYIDYPYADSDYWGSKSSSITYLDALYKLSTDLYPFESVTYENMRGGVNYIANLVYTYLSVYSMYTEFEVQKINSDTTIKDEATRNNLIDEMWDEYNKTAYQANRGLEQMASLYENELNSYMRKYDTEVYAEMEYNETHTYEMSRLYDATTKASYKVGSVMSAYQFKPVNSDVSYLIRKSEYDTTNQYDTTPNVGVNNFKITAGDMVAITENGYTFDFDFSEKIRYLSSDFMNLKKSTVPSGYNMIKSVSDIYPILDTTAFKSDNSGYLMPFIKTQLQYALLPNVEADSNMKVTDIPVNLPIITNKQSDTSDLKSGQFLMLDSTVDWDPIAPIVPNHDADTTWVNISQPISVSEGHENEVRIDVEDDIADVESVSNSEVAVMLSGQPSSSFTVENLSGGSCDVRVGDSGNLSNTTSLQKSGSVVTAKIKPNEDKVISKITLYDNEGEVLEYIYDANNIAPEEFFECVSVDENGYYTFKFPVPYQKSKVIISYKTYDSRYEKFDATIHNVTEDNASTADMGKITFATTPSSDEAKFKHNELVGVNVRPYKNYVCKNLYVKTDAGDKVEVTDVSDCTLSLTPKSKEYIFKMPARNVNIYAEFENGYTVTFDNKDINGKVQFDKSVSDCLNCDLTQPLTFAKNDVVNVEVIPDSGYYLDKIYIVDKYQNGYHYNYNGNSMSFRMPAQDLTVIPEFARRESGNHTVRLSSSGLCKLEFVDNGVVQNDVVEKPYKLNDTVNVKIGNSAEITKFEVNYYDENNEQVALPYTDNGDGTYTFNMPSSNVVVYAEAENHFYDANGFCEECGKYQPAEKDENNVYQIGNAGQLYWFAALVAGDKTNAFFRADDPVASNKVSAVLTNDITINPKMLDKNGKPYSDTSSYKEWKHIGDSKHYYEGTFDGQNHTISNLFINNTNSTLAGLFGYIGPIGAVKNVSLKDLYLRSSYFISDESIMEGGICGVNMGAVSGCSVSGYIELVDTQDENTYEKMHSVGGVCGESVFGTITDCHNSATINAGSESLTIMIGGICGTSLFRDNGVTNCSNTGDITSNGIYNCIGGISGMGQGISESYNSGKLYASNVTVMGGICGFSMYTVTDCYNTGEVLVELTNKTEEELEEIIENWNATHDESDKLDSLDTLKKDMGAGGLVGYCDSSEINNCYNIGKVSAYENHCGEIVAKTRKPEPASNCYYLVPDDTQITDDAMKHNSQFVSGEVAYNLRGENQDSKWGQSITVDKYPLLGADKVYRATDAFDTTKTIYTNTPTDGYAYTPAFDTDGDGYREIDNASKLYWFAEYVNSGNVNTNAILTDDITVNEGTITKDSTDAIKWIPIGSNPNEYKGVFDGNGKTISGLYFNDSSKSNVGLFSKLDSKGTIKNLVVTNSYFNGQTSVGGIAGKVLGKIENCHSSVTVEAPFFAGGVTGTVDKGKIVNCISTGTVICDDYFGAITGLNSFGNVDNCYYLNTICNGGISGGDIAGQAEAKTAEQFASGEVAYLLGEAFGQKIGTDSYPVLGGDKVYCIFSDGYSKERTYSNTPLENDVDLDGLLTIKDSTTISKYLVGRTELNDVQLSLADANNDGTVDVNDVTYIQKIIVGLI